MELDRAAQLPIIFSIVVEPELRDGWLEGVGTGVPADPVAFFRSPVRMELHHPFENVSNSYAYNQYQRQRQMTLGDLLLENRIVFLQGEIYSGNANEVVMKLLYLQSENKKKDIFFYINSPGGDVVATLAIYDVMQILTCPIATYCVGQAASGAAVLLAGGTKGKRYALPNSRIMIHQPHGGVGGQISDIEIQANEILRFRQLLNEIIGKHCGKTADEVARDMDRDFFMTAAAAKEYGLVDEITTRPAVSDDDDDARS